MTDRPTVQSASPVRRAAAVIGQVGAGVLRCFASCKVRGFWSRVFVVLLLLGAPGVADTLQEAVETATGVECCEGACDERGALGCAHACSHCACCAHPRAVVGAVQPLTLAPPTSAHAAIRRAARRPATGFRAPPFRPPAV